MKNSEFLPPILFILHVSDNMEHIVQPAWNVQFYAVLYASVSVINNMCVIEIDQVPFFLDIFDNVYE